MDDRVREQVHQWARRLIDLSKRNTSLVYRAAGAGRPHRSALEVVRPGPVEVLELILASPDGVRFFLPPQRGEPWTLEDLLAIAPPGELVTERDSRTDIEAVLRNLSRRAASDWIEKGLRTLYLCLGALRWRWRDPGGGNQEWVTSPLVFVPVTLERSSAGHPFRLKAVEDDAVTNASLRVLLDQQFGVHLPDIDSDITPEELEKYFKAVEGIMPEDGWEVQEIAVLKRATFQKEAMYRDLLANIGAMADHPVIAALAGQVPARNSAALAADWDDPGEEAIDDAAPPEQANLILDADASQRRVVHAAVQGASFVMDGPPGTGKSQTIANVIAELIARGRSVLFVSEKAAALDVVANRLADRGLGEFLLELHSQKVSRREVAAELGRALHHCPVPRSRLSRSELEQARQLRLRLSAYALAINNVREPLGRPASWVLGRLAQLADLPQLPPPAGIDETLSAEAMAELLERFEALARVWAPVERGEDFLWRGLLPSQRPGWERELVRLVERLGASLREAQEVGEGLADETRLPPPLTLHDLERLATVCEHAQQQPRTEPAWWSHPRLGELLARLDELQHLAAEQGADEAVLRERFGEGWEPLPVDGAARLAAALEVLASLRPALPLPPTVSDGHYHQQVAFLHDTLALCDELEAEQGALAQALGAPLRQRTVAEVHGLATVAAQADRSVRPEPAWASRRAAGEVAQALDVLEPLTVEYQQRRQALLKVFQEPVLDLDLHGLVERFRHHTGVRRLSKAYRQDKRAVAAVSRTGKASKQVLACLEEALQVQQLGASLERQEAPYRALLGRFYRPRATDTGAAREALQVLRLAMERLGSEYRPAAVAAQLAGDAPADPTLAARGDSVRYRIECWRAAARSAAGQDAQLDTLPLSDLRAWAGTALPALEEARALLAGTAGRAAGPVTVAVVRDSLERRANVQRRSEHLAAAWSADQALFGSRYAGFGTPFAEIRSALEWVEELQRRYGGPLPGRAVPFLRGGPVPAPDHLRRCLQTVQGLIADFCGAFETERRAELESELTGALDGAQALAARLQERHGQIGDWWAYQRRMAELRERGWALPLDACASQRVAAHHLPGVLERALLEAWVERVLSSDPHLRDLRADDLDATVASFQSLDARVIDDAAERVVEACAGQRPNTMLGAANIIEREARKQKRHMPVRTLLEKTGDLVQKLKPCFMMSPLTVSQFLPPSLRFDTVIFDEASQIAPEDAINCIYRGKQLIVAGDEKQLPPTPFFQRDGGAGEEGEYEEGQYDEFESILDQCKGTVGLPSLPLRWHYRSQHEHLITFSNYRFYEGRLVTFPGAQDEAEDLGVELIVVNGQYRRGGPRDNPIEAQAVAERVFYHARRHPDRSLGVVAFSQPQAQAIEDAVERLRAQHPELDGYFRADRLDGFFVKNLENVQGDERDIMLFSIGYGPDEVGKLTLNFGPLNHKNGWRRLNVAITRARRRVEVIASFTPEQLDVRGSSSRGIHELKRYLDYARRGPAALAIDLSQATGDVESPLEESVLRVIQGWGYEVVPQVGTAGYRIDLAVRDPALPGRFALGIECDGASYHSSKVARDRDRLRQEILTRLGWRLYRIWGPAWYRDRKGQEERLRAAIEEAINGAAPPPPARTLTRVERKTVQVEFAQTPPWVVAYQVAAVTPPPYSRHPADPGERPQLREALMTLIQAEAPVHADLLARRVASLWGYNLTERVRTAVRSILNGLARSGDIQLRGEFVWTGDQCKVRVPAPDRPETVREIVHVPPEELALAMRQLVTDVRTVSKEDLLTRVRSLFGFQRTGSRIRSVLEAVLDDLLTEGVIVQGADGTLRLPAGGASA